MKKAKQKPELRMYFFLVMYNISPIQQEINLYLIE